MPIIKTKTVSEIDLTYYLVAFDAAGKERDDDRDGLMSHKVLDALSSEPITDVFLISHGWMGDVPAAENQYNKWITAMAANQADLEKIKQVRPGFRPLIIGLHWPSLPWGNENLDDTFLSFDISENSQLNNDNLIEQYAQEVSDTERTREALRTIFAFADKTNNNNLPTSLPPNLLNAYQILIQEASISNEDENADNWNKNEPLDLNPESIYQASLTEETKDISFGIGDSMASAWDKFLQVPRLISFWKMKNLARQIGQTSGFDLLKKLQNKTNAQVRFHLIGHSFGTIVVSATIAGTKNNNKLIRPVNSLVLIQGAVSLWSYCKSVPNRENLTGYFYPIITENKVAGPIVTTQSQYDTAVGKAYPIAGTIGLAGKQDIDFPINGTETNRVKYPSVGGIGTYGIQGEGLDITNQPMLSVEQSYDFQPGKIYNLNSDEFIRDGKKDAHTAIAKPEVAHAVWSAALGRESSNIDNSEPQRGAKMSTEQEYLFFNGVNGATGDYALKPLTPNQVSQIAQGQEFDPGHLNVLKARKIRDQEGSFGPIEGVDPKNLAETGWGIIFAHEPKQKINPEIIKKALSTLLEHRREQAGEYYKEFIGDDAYFPPESVNDFLARFRAVPSDPADPAKVPYYLLIVGDPETIPFSFQYQLDVQYAVGRIYFDTLEEYAQYAQSVVAAETQTPFLRPEAKFFGVHNNDDRATELSREYLVKPLLDVVTKDKPNWDIQTILDTDATKGRLSQLLGGSETPSLLFSASHGMYFPKDDPLQMRHTGALLCQDWYSGYSGRIPKDWYFSADDIASDAKLLGMIAFLFACYGAGTPKIDEFGHKVKNWPDIAPRAFVAPLPKKLLSHPKGGALAVIGHVERAWGCSFVWDRAGSQIGAFKSTLKRLMEGHPVGSALEYFNQRYAALSSDITHDLDYIHKGKIANDLELSSKWTANNDARGYAIIGDPAVRLRIADRETSKEARPTIDLGQIVLPTPSNPISPPSPPAPPQNTVEKEPETDLIDIGFGPIDTLKQAQANLTQSLTQFSTKLATALQKTLDDTTTLEVSTYSSADLDRVIYDFRSGKLTGTAKLQALTRIKLDGDTMICVPEKNSEVDDALWKIHTDTVQQAQAHRAELLKVMVSSATSLLNALKGL